jgi:hypothetical protein
MGALANLAIRTSYSVETEHIFALLNTAKLKGAQEVFVFF